MYMEDLEEKLHSVAPPELKPKLRKRYVDDILEVGQERFSGKTHQLVEQSRYNWEHKIHI